MVTLQKSEKCKNHSNPVKITLKMNENYSKVSENHYKRVNFAFYGKLIEGQLFRFELSLGELPPKKWNLLFWSDFYLFWEWFLLG